MAIDKLVDSAQLDADLGSVADAIRAKSGGSGSLAFPAGFVTEIGNISGGGVSTPYDWMGKEAELFSGPYTLEKTLAETSYATWTPSTTNTTILASQTITSERIALPDLDQFDYAIRTRFDFRPVRVSGATAKNTVERFIFSGVTHAYRYITGVSGYASGTLTGNTSANLTNVYQLFYYDANGTLQATSGGYGVYAYSYVSIGTSTSGTTLTLTSTKTPTVYARCNSTYFSTARAAELDKAQSKFKFAVDIFRCKRTNLRSGVYMDLSHLYNNPL